MMVVMIITIIMIIMVKMIMISIYHHALLVVVVISIGELGKLCSKSISIIIITRPWPAGLDGIVVRIQLHMPCFAPMGNYDSARRDFPKLSGNRGNDKTQSIVVHCCPLLSIVVHCCPLLSIVVNCCPLLSTSA